MKPFYFTVPGWGGSSKDHWQTFFESRLEQCIQIEQEDFESPDLEKWVSKIEKVVSNYPAEQVVLIGHSLGCFAITEWMNRFNKEIRGAFLVAPADLENAPEIIPQKGFNQLKLVQLKSPSLIVASTNDEWLPKESALIFAKKWGSELRWIQDGGHISSGSGFGQWEEGLLWVQEF